MSDVTRDAVILRELCEKIVDHFPDISAILGDDSGGDPDDGFLRVHLLFVPAERLRQVLDECYDLSAGIESQLSAPLLFTAWTENQSEERFSADLLEAFRKERNSKHRLYVANQSGYREYILSKDLPLEVLQQIDQQSLIVDDHVFTALQGTAVSKYSTEQVVSASDGRRVSGDPLFHPVAHATQGYRCSGGQDRVQSDQQLEKAA